MFTIVVINIMLIAAPQCAFGGYFSSFTSVVNGARNSITNVGESVTGAVSGAVTGATGAVSGAVTGATGAVAGAVTGATSAVTGAVTDAVNPKVLSAITSAIPGTETLINSVKRASDISNTVTMKAFSGVSNAVSAAMYGVESVVSRAGERISNTVVPLPISLGGTSIGDTLNNVSVSFSLYVKILQSVIGQVNNTFTDVTEACERFVINGLDRYNPGPNSACFQKVVALKQNFTNTFATNAKHCVYNVINSINNHIAFIAELQEEINSAIQFGRIRIGLSADIMAASTTIPMEVGNIYFAFPICEWTQLIKSLMSLGPFLSSSVAQCFE